MREPGEGAVEYVKEQIAGLSQEHARKVIRELLSSQPDDPQVKKCAYCGYLFRDKTRPKNTKVCGPSCKTPVKTSQRRVQRAKVEIRPKKPPQYYYWHDYPFWISEKAMLSRTGSYERAFDSDKLQRISSDRDRKNRLGGSKKVIRKVEY
ncbi:hypothetical protein [Paenibacillus taiwanensis]|uniref:hypothetical protein n=1 Tax=Paenibacillus taiwanensis TaxID=401638 RepID=UPI00049006E4|nr:hypothetical protein [Paenibacillus taiwanensis]